MKWQWHNANTIQTWPVPLITRYYLNNNCFIRNKYRFRRHSRVWFVLNELEILLLMFHYLNHLFISVEFLQVQYSVVYCSWLICNSYRDATMRSWRRLLGSLSIFNRVVQSKILGSISNPFPVTIFSKLGLLVLFIVD